STPAYGLLLVFVGLSGLGSAAFHPEASKFAAYASGRKRASGMALFSVGGNLGYGLGAAVTTPVVVWLGLKGGRFLMVPCIFAGLIYLRYRSYLKSFAPEARGQRENAGEDRPGAMALLLAVILFRNFSWFGLLTFVPLWEESLGHSKAYGSHLL